MAAEASCQVSASSRRELAHILADLQRKAPRAAKSWLNLFLVRLSCCCGLRVSEIAGLGLSDVRLEPSWRYIRVGHGASKVGRFHGVPLRWDAGTLADVRDAAGHANVSITSAYLDVAAGDYAVGELCRF